MARSTATRAPISPRLPDAKTDRAVRDHARVIGELAGKPAAGMQVIADVALEDGVETPIVHKLGKVPTWVRESCVRGASTTGRVEEVRTSTTYSTYSRSEYVILKATGWGATITVDLLVVP